MQETAAPEGSLGELCPDLEQPRFVAWLAGGSPRGSGGEPGWGQQPCPALLGTQSQHCQGLSLPARGSQVPKQVEVLGECVWDSGAVP